MHRKNRVLSVLLGSLLGLGLMLHSNVRAQVADDAKAPMEEPKAVPGAPGPIFVPLNGTVDLQLTNKSPIEAVKVDKEGIVRIPGDTQLKQNKLTVFGQATGIVKIWLTGDNGKRVEYFEVIVQQDIELLKSLLRQTVPTASVTPIPGTGNTIILTGSVAHAEDIDTILGIARTFTAGGAGPASIINAMRVGGVQQVQLDVVVARVSRSELRRMAADIWQLGDQHQFTSVLGGSINVPAPASGITGTPGNFTITNIVGTPNGVPFNTFLGIFTNRQTFFIFLQALRDNSLAKLLAEPHLVTLSGRPAEFVDGGQQAVPQVGGIGGVAGVQFVDFGTTLNFLPIVLGNGKIYLEVEPGVSALDNGSGVTIPGGGFVPGRLSQRVHTSVEMEEGQTLAIGGMIQNSVQASTTKVPILGDLPFIGTLFSRKEYQDVEEELIVLVTPHLVDPMDCKQLPKFLPGQETRKPDDFELFLEGILEAPRGQREVWHDRHYVPAFKNGPTASMFPCGGGANGSCGAAGCGSQGCSSCGTSGCATSGCSTCGSNAVMAPKPAMNGTVVSGPNSMSVHYDTPQMSNNSGTSIVPVSGQMTGSVQVGPDQIVPVEMTSPVGTAAPR